MNDNALFSPPRDREFPWQPSPEVGEVYPGTGEWSECELRILDLPSAAGVRLGPPVALALCTDASPEAERTGTTGYLGLRADQLDHTNTVTVLSYWDDDGDGGPLFHFSGLDADLMDVMRADLMRFLALPEQARAEALDVLWFERYTSWGEDAMYEGVLRDAGRIRGRHIAYESDDALLDHIMLARAILFIQPGTTLRAQCEHLFPQWVGKPAASLFTAACVASGCEDEDLLRQLTRLV